MSLNNSEMRKVIYQIYDMCHDPNTKRGVIANIRNGISPLTEVLAYPHILPLLPNNAGDADKRAAILTAGLIASFPHIKMDKTSKNYRIGQWVTKSLKHTPSIEASILNLSQQGVNETAGIIYNLMSQTKTPYPLDWTSIALALKYWGDTGDFSHQENRLKIAQDYFSNLTIRK